MGYKAIMMTNTEDMNIARCFFNNYNYKLKKLICNNEAL